MSRTRTLRPRALWLTVPLYAVLLFIIVLDVWSVFFWTAVGDSIGTTMSVAAGAVVLVLTTIVLIDARRQWLLFRVPDEEPE